MNEITKNFDAEYQRKRYEHADCKRSHGSEQCFGHLSVYPLVHLRDLNQITACVVQDSRGYRTHCNRGLSEMHA